MSNSNYNNDHFRYLLLTTALNSSNKKGANISKHADFKTDISVGFKNWEASQQKVTFSGKSNVVIKPVLPGVSIQVPDNPIVNNKYNVFIQIRSGNSPTKAGINTIIVNCEAGGMGSKENADRFGNSNWINNQLKEIQSAMVAKFGQNVSLGKLGLGSFSGGYQAVGQILQDPQMKSRIDSVVILDGIHEGQRGKPDPARMKHWLDFANEAKNNPNKKFVVVYTAVDPGKYSSSSDAAKYLQQQTQAQNSPQAKSKQYGGVTPANISNAGGFTAIQLYDRKSDSLGYGYNEKEMKSQHISAANALPDVWGEFLADWN